MTHHGNGTPIEACTPAWVGNIAVHESEDRVAFMRRYLLAASTAAFVVIVSPTASGTSPEPEQAVEPAPVAVQRVSGEPSGLRDEAAMVLVGTGLLVLAAAVRRSA